MWYLSVVRRSGDVRRRTDDEGEADADDEEEAQRSTELAWGADGVLLKMLGHVEGSDTNGAYVLCRCARGKRRHRATCPSSRGDEDSVARRPVAGMIVQFEWMARVGGVAHAFGVQTDAVRDGVLWPVADWLVLVKSQLTVANATTDPSWFGPRPRSSSKSRW